MINVPLGFTKGSYILEFGREEDESPVTAGTIEVYIPTPTLSHPQPAHQHQSRVIPRPSRPPRCIYLPPLCQSCLG